MKVNYRGFEIDVHRDKCMAGYTLVYFSVFRISDGFELVCNYSDSSDTVRDYVKFMKERVDGFIKDPTEEILEETGESKQDYRIRIAEHRKENAKSEFKSRLQLRQTVNR